MMLASLEAFPLAIPFATTFRHASAERASTQALWVEARSRDGHIGYGEGCPREYVTGENLASAQRFFAAHRQALMDRIHDLDTLRTWVEGHAREIDANPAAWAAVELALLDLIGKVQARPVEALLGLPSLDGVFRYTAVLGDASPEAFEKQLHVYRKTGFTDFKVKLCRDIDRDRAKVAAFVRAGVVPAQVRADANNLWPDADTATAHLRALDFAFHALEEPLAAGDFDGLRRLASTLGSAIILDESLLRADHLSALRPDRTRWIANLRVSKMGGLLRSLDLAARSRSAGLGVIVGAHVGETSVLTRAALTVAASARDVLVAQEGAFGTHLLAHDVARPPLMFGPGGMLDAGALARPGTAGFGLDVTHSGSGRSATAL